MSEPRPISHEEALDRAPLFVLDALDGTEAAEVSAHLRSCSQPHDEFAELGGIVAHIPVALAPVDAPLEVRNRIAAIVRADANVAATSAAVHPGRRAPDDPGVLRRLGRSIQAQLPASPARIAAAVAIALLAISTIALAGQLRGASEREALLRGAVAALTEPGARVTPLSGDSAISGFAAFPPGRPGFLLVRGLPEAPPGKAYQAWFLAGPTPTSAGLLRSAGDGLLALGGLTLPRSVDAIALTLEASQGADRPTSPPVARGQVSV